MKKCNNLRRLIVGAVVCSVCAGLLAHGYLTRATSETDQGKAKEPNGKLFSGSMWGGDLSRNMVNLIEKNMPLEWDVKPQAKDPQILWFADLGSKAYGGPIIADGKIYIGTNNEKPRDKKYIDEKTGKPIDLGVIMCFRESDGQFLWQRIHHKLPGDLAFDWPREGICSTPVIEGDKIYYISNRCEVQCATTDGKDVWSLDMMNKLGVTPHNLSVCSPVVVGDNIFVVTANGVDHGHLNVPSPKAPSFICVNKRDGAVKWQNNDPSRLLLDLPKGKDTRSFVKKLVNEGKLLMHGQWSNPAFAVVNGVQQVIFPGGDGWMRAYEPETGKLIWEFDCNPKTAKYELGGDGTRNDFISTPVVYKNRLYIGVGQDPEHGEGIGHFWCIDLTKKGDISPVNDNFDPKAAINKNSGLVWHYGEPANAKLRVDDRSYVFGRTLSTAAIHDDLVYISELAGYLHCLDANTGKQLWVHYCGGNIWSSPYIVDGKVYMGTDQKKMLVFEHGRELKLLATNDLRGKVRATPVAASGVLYVMTENKLYAIKKK